MFLRCGKQFFAVRGEQRFVCRDDRLAKFQRGKNHRFGNGCAADKFDDDVYLGIVDDALPIGRHHRTRDFIGARLVKRFDCDFADNDLHANARSHEPTVELERVKYATAHCATANHAQIHLLHKGIEIAAKKARGQFNSKLTNSRVRSSFYQSGCGNAVVYDAGRIRERASSTSRRSSNTPRFPQACRL